MEVKIGGSVKSHASIRFTQGKHGNLPIMTAEDASDLKAISKICFIDFIAVPLVSLGEEITGLRKKLGDNGKSIHILAKID
jgi:pyruvate kinase